MATLQDFKKEFNELRDIQEDPNFEKNYKEVTQEMLEKAQWTAEESEAMGLLLEGKRPDFIRKNTQLNEESNKKIADMYFMILLNTLIRSKTPMPFKIPEQEINSWPENYSRNQFVAALNQNQDALKKSVQGKKVVQTASEYGVLYESMVKPNAGSIDTSSKQQQSNSSEHSENKKESTFNKAVDKYMEFSDKLDFLAGLANGLSPDPALNISLCSKAGCNGYNIGIFAKGIFDLGKLAASNSFSF